MKYSDGSIKITAVGDGGVGKTFMLVRYATKEIPLGYEPTIFDNHHCTIDYAGREYEAVLVDTAGQEATKSDLKKDQVAVTEEEVLQLVKKIKADGYIECSAYTKEGINDVFREAVRVVIEKKKRRCSIL